MIRQIMLLGFALVVAQSLWAQDPVFSQFYAAPLRLNPAFAGTTYAPRITLNYRNQWPSLNNAYETYAVSYEQSIEELNSGLGLMAMGDNAGDGIYKTNRFHAVYSYQVRVAKEFYMRIGIEAGVIQTRLDWDKLIFEDQIDPITGFSDPLGNPILSDEIPPENLTRSIFDISSGILFYSRNFYGGVSLKHLNTPDESLLEINQNLNVGLPLRTTVHAGAEFTLEEGNNKSRGSFISPNLMFIRQGDFGQINAGAYVGLGSVFGGLWYRYAFSNSDAAIALVGFQKGILRIGYSYDLTTSQLAEFGSGGAHEISLTINFDNSKAVQNKRRAARYNDCFKMFN